MKKLIFCFALLIPVISSYAGINILEIDWTRFKGAKVITTEMKGNDDSYSRAFLNEAGQVQSLEVYSEGSLFAVTVYDYDTKGRLARKVRYADAAHSRPGSIVTYSYNDKALTHEELTFMHDGSLLSRTVFKTNENGKIEEERYYLADNSLQEQIVYGYNTDGDLILKTGYHSDGQVFSVNKFTYDDHHNTLTWSVIQDGKSTDFSYAYDYDNKGNWVRRIEMSNLGSMAQTLELTIEYR